MTNPNKDTLDRHVHAVRCRDIDAVLATYDDDAVLVSQGRIGHGTDYIRSVFEATMDQAVDLEPETTTIEDGDVTFVTWRATQAGRDDVVGGETFVFADGSIAVHTVFITSSSGRTTSDLDSLRSHVAGTGDHCGAG